MRFNVPSQQALDEATTGELRCIQLWWPDNIEYKAMLAGLLYLLARGRTYDEASGSIKNAQAAGYRLFDVNVPLLACEGSVGPPMEPGGQSCNGAGGHAGGGLSEDCFMWAVTDITVESGVLVLHYGPCCRVEVDASTLITAGDSTPALDGKETNPYDELPEELRPSAYYACGKASAIVDKIFEVVGSVIDHSGNPLTIVKGVNDDVSDCTLNAAWLWNAYLAWLTISGLELVDPISPDGADKLWEKSTILDPYRIGLLKCWFVRRFADDNTRPTEADIDALRGYLDNVYPLFIRNMIEACILAIGIGDLRDIGQRGAANGGMTCNCPSSQGWYEVPSEATWAYLIDFTLDKWGFDDTGPGHNWTAGVGFTADIVKDDQTGNWNMCRAWRAADVMLSNTQLIYFAAHSPTLPTGTHMRNPLNFNLSGGVFYSTSNLPLLETYEVYIPAGVPWISEQTLSLFGGVTFDAGPLTMGTHTLDKIVVAGTGTPPFSNLTNLLA